MSKHAIEAFTDSLAAQLAPLGVQVNVVEPGNYDTDIGKNAAQQAGVDSRFADRSKYKKPDEVAAAVEPCSRRTRSAATWLCRNSTKRKSRFASRLSSW